MLLPKQVKWPGLILSVREAQFSHRVWNDFWGTNLCIKHKIKKYQIIVTSGYLILAFQCVTYLFLYKFLPISRFPSCCEYNNRFAGGHLFLKNLLVYSLGSHCFRWFLVVSQLFLFVCFVIAALKVKFDFFLSFFVRSFLHINKFFLKKKLNSNLFCRASVFFSHLPLKFVCTFNTLR